MMNILLILLICLLTSYIVYSIHMLYSIKRNPKYLEGRIDAYTMLKDGISHHRVYDELVCVESNKLYVFGVNDAIDSFNKNA